MKPKQVFALVTSFLLGQMWCSAANTLKVGDKAPEFQAAASDGSTVKLADYIGKKNIVLYFYPMDETPGCTKEACGIRDTLSELQDLDAVVFGVSFDSVESHQKFIKNRKLNFLLLADTDKKIAKAYGIATDKSQVAPRVTFIINKQGKIAYVNLKVNPGTHAAEVRTALAEMQQ
jgi:thioredoxin-dependent peroxiredoxin